MDRATLADWYEAGAELKRGCRPEDEPARLDARDLRHTDRLEGRSESLDRSCEEGAVCEQPEYVGAAVDPPEPAQELVGETHSASILGEAPVVVGPAFGKSGGRSASELRGACVEQARDPSGVAFRSVSYDVADRPLTGLSEALDAEASFDERGDICADGTSQGHDALARGS